MPDDVNSLSVSRFLRLSGTLAGYLSFNNDTQVHPSVALSPKRQLPNGWTTIQFLYDFPELYFLKRCSEADRRLVVASKEVVILTTTMRRHISHVQFITDGYLNGRSN